MITGWVKMAAMLYCGYYYIFRDYHIVLTSAHIHIKSELIIVKLNGHSFLPQVAKLSRLTPEKRRADGAHML